MPHSRGFSLRSLGAWFLGCALTLLPVTSPAQTRPDTYWDQTSNYRVTVDSAPFVSIVGEPDTTKLPLTGTQSFSDPIALPFAFQLGAGSPTNFLRVSTSGVIAYTDQVSFYNQYLPAYDRAIYAWWDYLGVNDAAEGVFIRTIGTAPERTFVIEFRLSRAPIESRVAEGRREQLGRRTPHLAGRASRLAQSAVRAEMPRSTARTAVRSIRPTPPAAVVKAPAKRGARKDASRPADAASEVTFQCRIAEATGAIELHYDDVNFSELESWADNGRNATVGLQISESNYLQYSAYEAALTAGRRLTFTPGNFPPTVAYSYPRNGDVFDSLSELEVDFDSDVTITPADLTLTRDAAPGENLIPTASSFDYYPQYRYAYLTFPNPLPPGNYTLRVGQSVVATGNGLALDGNDDGSPGPDFVANFFINRVPVIDYLEDRHVRENQTLTVTPTASDPDAGQVLTFSLEAPGTNATVDPGTGVITWTPPSSEVGNSYLFRLIATDNGPGPQSNYTEFYVTVDPSNFAPTLDYIDKQNVYVGTPATFTAVAYDLDTDQTLAFSLLNAPPGAEIDPVSGVFTFVPPAVGVYTVTVVATDNGSPVLDASQEVVIEAFPADAPPVLQPLANQSVGEGALLTFTASATDPDAGQSVSFSLDAGAPSGAFIDPTSGVFTWTPDEAQGGQTYAITVRATDDAPLPASSAQTIQVTVNEVNSAPVLAPLAATAIAPGRTLTVAAQATDPDLPAQTLSYSLGAGSPAGATIDPATGLLTWVVPANQRPGRHVLTVRVTDDGLPPQLAEQLLIVDVNAFPASFADNSSTYQLYTSTRPFVSIVGQSGTAQVSVSGNGAVSGSLTLPFSFPLGSNVPTNLVRVASSGALCFGNTVSYSNYGLPSYGLDGLIAGFWDDLVVNTGGGRGVFWQTVGTAPNRTVIFEFSRVSYWARSASDEVTFQIRLQETSGVVELHYADVTFANGANYCNAGASATVGLQATPQDALQFSLNEASLSPNLVLSFVPAGTAPVVVACSPANALASEPANTLRIAFSSSVVVSPADLTLTRLGTGSTNLVTGATFSYDAATATATLTFAQPLPTDTYSLRVASSVVDASSGIALDGDYDLLPGGDYLAAFQLNAAPVFAPIADQTVDEETQLTFTASATDPDAGQTVTYSLGPDAPSGAYIDPSTGVFTWTPSEYQGPQTYAIQVIATDNGNGSRQTTQVVNVTVREVNLPPVLNPIENQFVAQGDTLGFYLNGYDFDYPYQPLTYTLAPDAPAGAAVDSNGYFTFNNAVAGTYTITVSLTDDGIPPLTATRSFDVTVVPPNHAPVLAAIPDVTVPELSTLSFTASATDPDGHTLVYELENAPFGASIDSATGAFTWTPDEYQGPGVYTITVRVTDIYPGQPLSDAKTFVVTVAEVNAPPVLATIGPRAGRPGRTLSFQASATDNDYPAQTLTYSLDAGAPAGATIDPSTGAFSWPVPAEQPFGVVVLTVRVTDSGTPALSASETIQIDINNYPATFVDNSATYQVYASSAPFISIVGQAGTTQIPLSGDDNISGPVNLPFPFFFTVGQASTQIRASTNGIVTFGTSNAYNNGSLPDGSLNNTILAFWDDLFISSPGQGVFTQTVGTAPFRTFIIEFHNLYHYGRASNEEITFQVRLKEGTGAVDVHYGDVTFGASQPDNNLGASATIGIQVNTSDFLQYSFNEGSLTNDLVLSYLPSTQAPIVLGITPASSSLADPTNVVRINFSKDVIVSANDLTLTRAGTGATNLVPGAAFSYNAATATATLTFPQPLPLDTYALKVAQTVVDANTGLALDGDFDTQPGGDYTGSFRLNTAPVVAAVLDQTVAEETTLTFTASANDPDAGQTLQFSLGAGAPSGASIHASTGVFTWTPSEFQGPGTYPITIVATDNGLGPRSGSRTFNVTVLEVNRAPVLPTLTDRNVIEGGSLAFYVGGSDPDSPSQSLTYSLSPGAPAGAAIDPGSGYFTFNAGSAADYTITVNLADNGTPPLATSASFVLHVVPPNTPPVLAAIPDQAVAEGSLLSFTASAVDPDAGQTVTYSLASGAPSGASIHPSTGVFSWTPSEAQGPGVYTITVRATDNYPGQPLTDAKSFQVSVSEVNVAPTLAAISAKTVAAGSTLAFTAVGSDSDLPAQTLTYSLDAGAPVGAGIHPSTGAFSWAVPGDTAAGTYSVTVRVTDNGTPALSATASVQIFVNRAPVLAVLPDRTVDELTLLTFTASAVDPDAGQSVAYSLAPGAPSGASIHPSTGVFSWTPSEAQGPGVYTLTVRATDNDAHLPLSDAKSFQVTVNEVNVAPTLASIAPKSAVAGTTLTFTAVGSDTDVPAQTLTYSLEADAPAGATIHPSTGVFSWEVPAAPSATLFTLTVRVTDNGTPALSATRTVQIYVDRPPVLAAIGDQTVDEQTLLTFTASAVDPDAGQTLTYSLAPGAPSGASIHPSTGVFSWTPTEAQGPGTYNITVRVTDNAVLGALSDAKTFAVTVNEVNLAPTLAAIPAKAVVAGSVVTFTAAGSDADLPAQPLTYTLEPDAPAGAAIHPTTGAFTWATPANPESTPVLFTVRVSDNGTPPLSATRSVVVHLNRPPVLAAIADRVVDERTLLTFAASALDPDVGQTLTFSLAPGAPSGASIHPSTGVFTWTPSEAQGPGSYNLTVRVTDNGPSNPLTDAKSFNVVVNDVNSAPLITPVGPKTIGAGNELTFTVAASDSDLPAQTLAFSLDPGAPAGASIDPVTGFFRWNVPLTTPSGPVPVTVRVTDNGTPALASTQAITITVDNDGPVLSNLKFAGSGLVDGATIVRTGAFSVQATDSAGVSRVVFAVQRVADGATVLNVTDLNGADGYSAIWGVNALPDGAYLLTVTGYDSYGISSVLTRSLTLSLAVPLAPVITSPANNSATSRSLLTVRGTAPAETEVSVFLGGVRVPPAIAVGASGEFTAAVTLQEGNNDLSAVATNRAGDGPSSATVRVLLDSTIPAPPTGIEVLAYEGGRLRVQWHPPAGVSVQSYAVYRSTSPFTDPAAATRIASAVAAIAYDDFPQPDGTYYYALTTTNTAGTTGSLSACVSASVDRTAPVATSIVFTHRDPSRYQAPRYGQGFVDVLLNLSEAASSTPFLSVTPPGSAPLPIELTKVNDTRYTGVLILTSSTTSGTGLITFSARDAAGNRGSTVQSGGTIEIDTSGPDLTSLAILSPAVPIKNDPSPASVNVRIQLSEAPQGLPTLKYRLASSHPTPTALTLTPGADARTFEASFLLPANAGQTAPEDLSFEYTATDDLQNISTRIASAVSNRYLVYQGALPDLPPPAGLVAVGRAGGLIELAWSKVNEAAGYRLYRSSVNGTVLTALADLDDPNTITTTDTPGVDGTYRYAIATKRSANGQTSEGAQSTPSVSAVADSVAPGRPLNLHSNLAGNGVQLGWQPPAEAGPFKYRIYRAAAPIAATNGLTPIANNVNVTAVTDPFPTPAQPYYAITTLDAVGNESIPSESTYLNATLLPVSSLSITQIDGDKPLVQWTPPPGTFVGYNLYVGAGAGRVRLNGGTPLAGTSFVDTGFPSGGERVYSVTVVDQQGVESAERSILLPQAGLSLAADAVVRRGLMNALFFSVVDGSTTDLAGSKLSVNLGGVTSVSPTFTAVAGAATLQKVVVGGYASLSGNSAPLEARLIVTPNVGETVQIVRSLSVPVTDGGLDLQVLPGSFVRGGNGQLQFQLTNASAEPIEIVVARSFGTQPSDRTRLRLTNAEGNSLATATVQLNSGASVITLANGTSVIRIAGGAQFTSDPLTIAVPPAAPLSVYAQIEIDKVYYHLGQADSVELNGPTARVPVSLTEVSYGAIVANALPAVSNGDQNVTISGQALDRLAATPVANVPVKIGILLNGFERTAQVVTNGAGDFSYQFRPLPGEAGIYSVYATHPELNGRQIQKTFSINRVTIDPQTVRLRVPRSYPYDINLTARAVGGTTATNLRLEYVAADQAPAGSFLPGITITPSAAINLGPGETGGLSFKFLADNTANGTGSLRVRVASDESGTSGWTMVNVTYELVTATPVLGYSPTLLDTGVNPGGAVTETIRLSNIGLAAFSNVQLSLLQQNGANTYSPAPSWITLTVPAQQGGLALNETRDVGINIQPPASVALGDYLFVLRVESATAPPVNIPIHVAMTSGVKGNVIFKVLDLYTGEPDPAYAPPGTADHPTPTFSGVRGATVTLQNVATPSFTRTVTTNGYGEADFRDSHEPLPGYGLPAGRYRYRITADRHDPVTGQVDIRPSVTSTESVPMNMQLVSIEFSVVPINLQDRYTIILSATFETHVPAPVVVVNPGYLNIPQMCAGDVYQGEFTITNYGLVRADNVRIPTLPSDQYFQFELLNAVPTSIAAGEVITIPYRLRCLSPLAGNCPTAPAAGARPNADGLQPVTNSGGGAPCSYSACISIPYEYVCANGLRFTGTASYCAGYSACPPGTPSNTSGPSGPGGPVGGWGGPSGLSGTFTSPCCEDKDKKSPTGSSVNRVTGKYSDDVTDLRGYAPGLVLDVTRSWNGTEWKFARFFNELVVAGDGNSASYAGATYQKNGNNFVYSTGTISPKAGGGWRLVDSASEQFREFNASGWMTALGTGTETQATLEYTSGGSGNVAFIRDGAGVALLTFTYDGQGRVAKVISREGGDVRYTYTGSDLTTVFDAGQNLTTTYGYDASHRMTSKVFPDGHERRITYHPNLGYVTSVLDENNRGKTFEFSYNAATREYYSKVTETGGKVTESYFDSKSNEKRVDVNGVTVLKILRGDNTQETTDGRGNRAVVSLSDAGRVSTTLNPDGSSVRREYDRTTGALLQQTDERGIVTSYEYGPFGATRIVQAAGTPQARTTVIAYDALGRVQNSRILGGPVQDAVGNVVTGPDGQAIVLPDAITQYEYDAYGRVVAVIDPEGHRTEGTYDERGNLVRQRDGNANETVFEYHPLTQKLTKKTTPGGKSTTLTYDNLGRLRTTTDPLGKTVTMSYAGRRIIATGPDGSEAYTELDLDGRLVRAVDAEGVEVRYEYDIHGRRVKQTDGSGNIVSTTYDPFTFSYEGGGADLVSTVTTPAFTVEHTYGDANKLRRKVMRYTDGTQTTVDYTEQDVARAIQVSTNSLGERATTEQDRHGNQISTSIGLSSGGDYRRAFVYDNRGNLLQITDANGQTTHLSYDRAGRLVRKTLPNGQVMTWTYDGADHPVASVDALGRKTELIWNSDGRVTTQNIYPTASASTPLRTILFTYDDAGRMTSATQGDTGIAYTYDDYGRISTETTTYGPGLTLSHSFTYQKNDLVKTYTGPDGLTYSYTYVGGKNLATISAADLGTITYNEYLWYAPRRVSYPGGVTREVVYGGAMKPQSITFRGPGGDEVVKESYAFDAVGQLLQRLTLDGVTNYAYDGMGQLVSVNSLVPSVPSQTFNYDRAFNRTAVSGVGTISYTAGNQLQAFGTESFVHDANGDLTTRTDANGSTSYIYGSQQELAEIQRNGATVATYGYDALGRRLWKDVGGTRTFFHWVGSALVAEAQVIGGTLTVTRTYGYRPNQTDGLEPIFLREGGNYYYYANDYLGTPVALVAGNGTVVWSARYEAFGRLAGTGAATLTNHLRGSNQYFDAESGLHYNLQRYYDPVLGRYLQADPLGTRGDINAYAFANNAPQQLVDPEGTQSQSCDCPPPPPPPVCVSAKIEVPLFERKFNGPPIPMLGLTTTKFKFSIKIEGEGKICYAPCPGCDGKRGISMEAKGSISAGLSGGGSSAGGELFGVSLQGGVMLSASGSVSLSLSISKPACKDAEACVEGEYSGSASLTIGGGLEGEIKEGATGPLARYVGTKVKVGVFGGLSGSAKGKCKLCLPLSFNCDPVKICVKGEIYAEAKVSYTKKYGEKRSESVDLGYRYDILKGEYCF